MSTSTYISFLLIVLLTACHPNTTTMPAPADSTIVLIFKDAPKQSEWATKQYGTAAKEFTLSQGFRAREKGYDTLVLKTTPSEKDTLYEVYMNHRGMQLIEFPIINGDTVLFEYDSTGYATAQSLRYKKYSPYYNLIGQSKSARMKNGFTYFVAPRSLLSVYLPFDMKNIWVESEYNQFITHLKEQVDALDHNDPISAQFYHYYTPRIIFNKINTRAMIQEKFDNQKSRFSFFQKELYPYLDDNKIFNTLYTTELGAWLRRSKDDRNQIIHWVNNSDSIPPLTKNMMLKIYMTYIFDTGELPADTLLKYTRLYVQLTGDTSYQKKLAEMERNPAYTFKDDLQLISLSGDTTLFQNVIKQHAGKVIYVDYWASWCAPCRREMPAAKKLREAYKDKEVVFIYLALNDTPDKWREAVKKEQTDYLGINYIINNPRKATMIDELKIERIPRFMIYDRSGKLVEINAPRPSTPEVRKLLDKYLVK